MIERFDADSLTQAILLLDWSDDVCNELRAWGDRNIGLKHGTISGYFTDPGLMGDAAAEWSGKVGGVYFVLNPIYRRCLARCANRLNKYTPKGDGAKDDEIERRRWLFIDLDVEFEASGRKKPRGTSSTDEEHQRALLCGRAIFDYLHEKCPARRLVLADSGNGAHVLAKLEKPNDDDATHYVENRLKHLATHFSDLLKVNGIELDTTTHNAARLCKFYGTMACKGDPIDGNVHRLSRILEDTDVRG